MKECVPAYASWLREAGLQESREEGQQRQNIPWNTSHTEAESKEKHGVWDPML
jgi:hypothetical protein